MKFMFSQELLYKNAIKIPTVLFIFLFTKNLTLNQMNKFFYIINIIIIFND